MPYKLFKNELPVSLTKWQAEKKTGLVLRNNYCVKLPIFSKIAYKKSFAYRSAVIWNQLSNETVDQNSTNSFKIKLSKEINLLSFAEGGMRQKDNDFILLLTFLFHIFFFLDRIQLHNAKFFVFVFQHFTFQIWFNFIRSQCWYFYFCFSAYPNFDLLEFRFNLFCLILYIKVRILNTLIRTYTYL